MKKRKIFWRGFEGRTNLICRDGSCIAWTRVLARNIIGRELKRNEIVHHVDGNPGNDSHNNLVICTVSYHREFLHEEIRKKRVYIVTNKKFWEIRASLATRTMSRKEIAKFYGIDLSYIYAIANNRIRR